MNDDLVDSETSALPDFDGKLMDATGWLNTIDHGLKVFEAYQDKCDNIDRLYADLDKLSNISRDRDFQLFWANVQVLAPSIYSRPPVPVVVPKFTDYKPVARVSSEVLERCSLTTFDMSDIDGVMIELRDDLAILARGAGWVRYEDDGKTEKVCVEHLDRKDFLHEPARKWSEVGWVARRAWLTKKEMRKRFQKTSGKTYQDAAYSILKDDKENGANDGLKKAGVWEIWSKTENKVIWVSKGCDKALDSDKPHLNLEGFFPCPKPAYGTRTRRSLVPVPDFLYYKDQLEEIAELTKRIHALSQAVKVKGFYPSSGEQGDAIETALKSTDDRRVMVPVANWAAFGGNGGSSIEWLPVDMIVTTIAGLVELRRQVIEDVYQIMGLSDIMRGSTDSKETLGAQQLKSQYGSVRIRDKQSELVRIARDLVRIAAEIIAENFTQKTIIALCQMELPTDADIKKQIKQVEDSAEQQFDEQAKTIQQQLQDNPEMAQQGQQNPEQAQQMMGQAQDKIISQAEAEIKKISEKVTIDQVMSFLRDEKLRPFTLDIETDSTIQPDEQAEKEMRNEFMGAFMQSTQALGQLVTMVPESAGLAGALLKFVLAPYRAGRELDGHIDDFVDSLTAKAGQPQPNPQAEAEKAKLVAEDKRVQGEMQIKQADMQMRQQEMQGKAQMEQQKNEAEIAIKAQDAQAKQQEVSARLQTIAAQNERDDRKHRQDMERGNLEMQKIAADIERTSRQSDLAERNQTFREVDAANRAAGKAMTQGAGI